MMLFKLFLEQYFSCLACCVLACVQLSGGCGVLVGKAPGHEGGVGRWMLCTALELSVSRVFICV